MRQADRHVIRFSAIKQPCVVEMRRAGMHAAVTLRAWYQDAVNDVYDAVRGFDICLDH